MNIRLFYHSLLSDWNHGNAHFLRGVVSELLHRGHDVRVYEPLDAWSVQNLVADAGEAAIEAMFDVYPSLRGASVRYDPADFDVAAMLDGADLVLVHEWNDPALVQAIGDHRAADGSYHLLFHDTHHRAVTAPQEMARYDLSHYDGVLAFGEVLRRIYLERRWTPRAWTWHEAADTRVFRPIASDEREGDLVWVGNWGDDERTAELQEFLLDPVATLSLRATIHGVRYPDTARAALARAGIRYAGWLANHQAPHVFARHAVTVHVPRRPYVQALPGIPTIRVFEALACGIPLICAPWDDAEHLFTPGEDYLVARDGTEMTRLLRSLLDDPDRARSLASRGHRTLLSRHTCAHRVTELMDVVAELDASRRRAVSPRRAERDASIVAGGIAHA